MQSAINNILRYDQADSMKTVLKSQMKMIMEVEQKRYKPDGRVALNTTANTGITHRLPKETNESNIDPLQILRHTTAISAILKIETRKLAAIMQLLKVCKRSRLFQAHQKNDSVRLVMADEEIRPFKIYPVDRKSFPASPMGFYSERGSSSVFQSSTEGLNTTEVDCGIKE
eukprot:TRINITY_DN9885_c0_g1_i4.p1 TRINITY_DN9885_c0_g1~~TRINITY_DN9885_c0_g1_i4.p1  ORF type:complete len:171 (+),score=31.30 TRINITY_DN9885_c0_g1_i4:305-817(+)